MALYLEELDPDDDVFTVEAFKGHVGDGFFTDYDGFGHPVKDGKVDHNVVISPSKLEKIPEDATHIVWYNR